MGTTAVFGRWDSTGVVYALKCVDDALFYNFQMTTCVDSKRKEPCKETR